MQQGGGGDLGQVWPSAVRPLSIFLLDRALL